MGAPVVSFCIEVAAVLSSMHNAVSTLLGAGIAGPKDFSVELLQGPGHLCRGVANLSLLLKG